MQSRLLVLLLALAVSLCGSAAAQQDDWIPVEIESPITITPEWDEPDSPLLALAREDGLIHMEDIDAPLRDYLQQRARCVFDTIRPSQLMQRLGWVKEVDLSEFPGTLSDIRWFYMFDNLTSVTLTDATMDNLDVIAGFANLETLTLLNCGYFDLTPLSGCKKLAALTLGWDDSYQGAEGAFDLTPLMKLENLQTLRLYGTGFVSLEAFTSAAARRVRTLTLSDTAIDDFAALSKFTKLNSFTLDLLHSTSAAAALSACPATVKELTLKRLILNADTDAALKRFKSLTDYTLSDCDASNDLFYENLNKATRLTVESVSMPNGDSIGTVYADKTTMVLRGVPEPAMLYLLDNRAGSISQLTVELSALTDDLNAALKKKTSLNTLTLGLLADTDLAGDMWNRVTGINTLTIESDGHTLLSTDFVVNLPRVYALTLQGVRVENTAGFAVLEYVTDLSVIGCRIADWSFLSGMKRVSTLRVYACALTNDALPTIAAMHSLSDLRLNGNEITSIAALTAASALRKLDILDNPIVDYTPLLLMPALTTVYSNQSGVITNNSILARSVYIDDVDYRAIEQEAFGD